MTEPVTVTNREQAAARELLRSAITRHGQGARAFARDILNVNPRTLWRWIESERAIPAEVLKKCRAIMDNSTQQFLNRYRCPECAKVWYDVWTAKCDDECPYCGTRNISPEQSEDLPLA